MNALGYPIGGAAREVGRVGRENERHEIGVVHRRDRSRENRIRIGH